MIDWEIMNKTVKIVIVITLIVTVGIVVALKQKGQNTTSQPVAAADLNPVSTQSESEKNSQNRGDSDKPRETVALPRLVDLGADKCIPCKMMAPMLEEMKKEYAGTFNVEFIDVWKNPEEAKKYGIKIIPTQIFFDASGKELFRHEGFFSKEDILNKWEKLGINLEKGQQK